MNYFVAYNLVLIFWIIQFVRTLDLDRVWIWNYEKEDKWIPGTVIGCTGLVTYQVKSHIGKQHKHVDQLRYKPDDDLDTSIEPNESPSVINDHVSPAHTAEYHQNLNNPLVFVPMNNPNKIRDYNEAPPTSQTPTVKSKPECNPPNQNTKMPIEKPTHNDTTIWPRHNWKPPSYLKDYET